MKIYIVSLGCPKNLTDTEVLMGKLVATGYEITGDPSKAETIIVNTCAFLKSAREEAEKTILEMAKWKKKGKCKKLYIAGCYPMLIKQPSISANPKAAIIEKVDGIIDSIGIFNYCTPRVKATPPWYAYVKIAEGCNHRCSYCLIPTIRGRLRVRKPGDILEEVRMLAKRGVKEIIFVAQDTTAYPNFSDLLRKTAKIQGIRWIRIMYAHPEHLNDKLIKTIRTEKKVVKYLDLPIQHVCDRILRLMNRAVPSGQALENLVSNIRRRIPKIALRTSVIVGFPGESEAEFKALLDFIGKVRFEKLGAFPYSREKGTPAYEMRGQVPEKIRKERLKRLMRVQSRISRELNRKMIGNLIETIIEGAKGGRYYGRAYFDAPEIDGKVIMKSTQTLKPGKIVKVRITGANTYDLFGLVT